MVRGRWDKEMSRGHETREWRGKWDKGMTGVRQGNDGEKWGKEMTGENETKKRRGKWDKEQSSRKRKQEKAKLRQGRNEMK